MANKEEIRKEVIDELLGSRKIKIQDDLFRKDGLLKQLSKRLIERLLEAEMTHHLGYSKYSLAGRNSGSSRNGKDKKAVKTGNGDITIAVPRGREGEFEPILIEKRKSHLKRLDDQILSLYAKGMPVRDIHEHLSEVYGTEISRDLISPITDVVLEIDLIVDCGMMYLSKNINSIYHTSQMGVSTEEGKDQIGF